MSTTSIGCRLTLSGESCVGVAVKNARPGGSLGLSARWLQPMSAHRKIQGAGAGQARQRYLSKDELRRLGVALGELEANNAHGFCAAAAIRLLLLTGARVNEVLQARWDWVDWDRKCIVPPDSNTGSKPIFLSDPTLAVLRDLSARPEAATGGFIIKGRLPGKNRS